MEATIVYGGGVLFRVYLEWLQELILVLREDFLTPVLPFVFYVCSRTTSNL